MDYEAMNEAHDIEFFGKILQSFGIHGDPNVSREETVRTLARTYPRVYDMTELGGDHPTSLAEFLEINDECPPDLEEVYHLFTCEVAGEVRLGIGGGYVTVQRVA